MGRRLDRSSPLFCLSGGDSAGAATRRLSGELQRRLHLCSRSSSQSRFAFVVPFLVPRAEQANPSTAAHRADHSGAVSLPFFEPEPSPSRSTLPRTSTVPPRPRLGRYPAGIEAAAADHPKPDRRSSALSSTSHFRPSSTLFKVVVDFPIP